MTIYDFEVMTNRNEKKTLAEYQGKVMLIVNTASKCGFTSQYDDLQALYEKYADKGLVILGFPCNQFADQEPEDDEAIAGFCRLNYGVKFPLFAKGDVRGETAQEIFKYLVSEQGFKGFDDNHPIAPKLKEVLKNNYPEYLTGDDIKWNFTKFLVNREGKVIQRFEPTAAISVVDKAISDVL